MQPEPSGDEAIFSPDTCIEPGCDRPRWTVMRRERTFTVSQLCFEHSNVAMFDVPAQSGGKPKRANRRLRSDDPGKPLLSAFHSEVRRQRLEREGDA